MRNKEQKLDKAVKDTFPASDPPATGTETSTEPAKAPVDRQPAPITREEIEAAERDEGHRHLHEERNRKASTGREPASDTKGEV
jgi:hypothetical protein